MSSFCYDLAQQGFMAGSFDLATANIKVALVQISGSGTPYTANQATDQYLSVIPSGAIAATTANLTSVSITNGVFGAANASFGSVTFGQPCGAIVFYIDTGNVNTSPLLFYMDSSTYAGLPITPIGTTISLSFSPTGNQIAAFVS
jgi:hypothetical protein